MKSGSAGSRSLLSHFPQLGLPYQLLASAFGAAWSVFRLPFPALPLFCYRPHQIALKDRGGCEDAAKQRAGHA